jgi:hypothetical protein
VGVGRVDMSIPWSIILRRSEGVEGGGDVVFCGGDWEVDGREGGCGD